MRSATTSDFPTMTCRFESLRTPGRACLILTPFRLMAVPMLFVARLAYAGHAGEMESPALFPHELLVGLVGLAVILLFTVLALTWVVWRLRGLDRRLRDLEGDRKD